MTAGDQTTGKTTSFRRRLLLIFSGFTLCFTLVYTFIDLINDIHTIRSHAAEKAELLAHHLAETVRLPLFAADQSTLQQLATKLATTHIIHNVTISNTQGQQLASAGQSAASLPKNAIFYEIQVLPPESSQGAEEALGLATAGTTRLPLGKVRVVMDNATLRQGINQQIASSLLTALFFWLAFSYLSVLIVRWVSTALAPLINGLRTIQRGDFSPRIATSRFAELAEATNAVNELAAGLQQRDEENQRLQQELLDAMKHEVREERRQLMAKLIQTNKMTALGLMASAMAHEINTPNGAIRLAGQQMSRIWTDAVPILDRVAAEEGDFNLGGVEFSAVKMEMNKGMEIINRSSERINQVINDLRDFTVGEQSTTAQQVDLNQVVTDSLAIILAHGRQGRISIEHQLLPDLPPVPGNRYQLGQVIINLLLNGIQAIPAGQPGRLDITTAYDPVSRLVTVTVQDDGEGMSADVRKRLLEPFFTTRLETGGSGLGLYITNYLITKHRGTLAFKSQPGAGTTVTVSLPVAT